ncbi:MAG TPA: glycosyltransferase family 4 protein [Chthoniobacterales bacterium]
MRIGLVRRGYSPAGGAESYLRGFAKAAVQAGHETVLFASPEWQDWSFGRKIVVEGKSPQAFSEALERIRPHGQCDCLLSLERVSSCDVYRAGDGVHASWLARRALLASPLKRLTFTWNPKHRALLNLEKRAVTGARRIIANSWLVRNEIELHYGREIAAKVSIVHNGIDVARWAHPAVSRDIWRAQNRIPASQKVAVFAGSGWERKGLRYAVDAVSRLPDVLLLVAGKGDPRRFAGPNVKFLGPITDMPSLLHASDAFILPTIYDPFSNACLEALAAGLPVITTQANGFAEIQDRATDGAAVSAPNDISALEKAVEFWLASGARAERQQHAAVFSLERNLQATLSIITS